VKATTIGIRMLVDYSVWLRTDNRLVVEFSSTDGVEDGGKLFIQNNPLK
jgi:hypothetical protein